MGTFQPNQTIGSRGQDTAGHQAKKGNYSEEHIGLLF
jgi:hypothetical protein